MNRWVTCLRAHAIVIVLIKPPLMAGLLLSSSRIFFARSYGSEVLLWSSTVPTAVRPSLLLPGVLVRFERFDLRSAHQLWDSVGLELLEGGTQTLIRVVFLVCLVFVVLDADEVRVDAGGI